MKRKILMASSAMLIAMAALANNSTKIQSCCSGSKCAKVCTKNCDCGQKHCSPENCKSKDCSCRK